MNQWEFIDSVGFLRGFPKNLPKFILGQGYGALLATRFLQHRADFFEGAMVINPLYAFKEKFGGMQLAMMKAKIFMDPYQIVSLKLDSDSQALQDHASKIDSLHYFDWQLSHFMSTIEEQKETLAKMKEISTPTLMVLSDKD